MSDDEREVGDWERLSDRHWVEWFMRNIDDAPLVTSGYWMRPTFALRHLSDDVCAVARAAFKLGETAACWDVIIDALRAALGDHDPPPLSREAVSDRVRALRPDHAVGRALHAYLRRGIKIR